jgi:DHA1 family bicyclomycin/chloramphenicol resistance-like MFS transporter
LLLSILIATSFILIIRKVPETIEKADCNALHFRTLIGNYRDILTNRLFMFNTIAAGLAVSMLILFGVLSTFIFQNHYHLTSMQYAWIMMLVTAASVLSRTANIFILRRTSPETCIQIGLYFMLGGALTALTTSILEMHFVFCIIIPAMISILGAGLIPSNTMAIALAPLRQKGGTAGAIYGSITMLCVFLVSCAGSILPTTSLSLALIFLTLSLLSWIMIKLSVAASLVTNPEAQSNF